MMKIIVNVCKYSVKYRFKMYDTKLYSKGSFQEGKTSVIGLLFRRSLVCAIIFLSFVIVFR